MNELTNFWQEYSTILITIVLALIVLMVFVAALRAFNNRTRGRRGRRLAIMEFRELDPSRRLVLVRRDNVEHLLLVGGNNEVVIETGITAGSDAEYDDYAPVERQNPTLIAENEPQLEPDPAPASRPAPRPAVFGDRAPNLRPVHRDADDYDPPDRGY